MLRAIFKEILKTFVPGDRSFKAFNNAHNEPGSSLIPYKIQILQLQTVANNAQRRSVVQTISQRIEDHPDFLDFIFFNDEANFRLSGYVNKQNMLF